MPEESTIKKFVKAIQTGRTHTTKALDSVDFNPHLGALGTPNVVDTLPDWARAGLQPPLSDAELDHIDSWPKDQKELVRQAVVTATQAKRKVQFFWELHSGTNEATDIQGLGGTGTVTIIFRSPRSKVKVSMATFGDISVDV